MNITPRQTQSQLYCFNSTYCGSILIEKQFGQSLVTSAQIRKDSRIDASGQPFDSQIKPSET